MITYVIKTKNHLNTKRIKIIHQTFSYKIISQIFTSRIIEPFFAKSIKTTKHNNREMNLFLKLFFF